MGLFLGVDIPLFELDIHNYSCWMGSIQAGPVDIMKSSGGIIFIRLAHL
jgi:hypothetical protein